MSRCLLLFHATSMTLLIFYRPVKSKPLPTLLQFVRTGPFPSSYSFSLSTYRNKSNHCHVRLSHRTDSRTGSNRTLRFRISNHSAASPLLPQSSAPSDCCYITAYRIPISRVLHNIVLSGLHSRPSLDRLTLLVDEELYLWSSYLSVGVMGQTGQGVNFTTYLYTVKDV
jgi:hypothetical protein